jgi:amino acid adenylation domain-containing protein
MAETRPAATFLVSPETGQELTFKGLQEQAVLLAEQLREIGLEQGDKVAFLLDNGLFAARLFLGAMYGGFVSVPLNVHAGPSQLSYTLDHCDAEVVFVSGESRALIDEVLPGIQRPIQVIAADVEGALGRCEPKSRAASLPAPGPDDIALLMYTSGSTDRPRAAVHSHRGVLAAARNSVLAHQLSPGDRSLLVLPLYHINAECVTLVPALLSGGSVVVPARFSVSRFWDWLDEYRCTWSALVPTIISQLLDWEDPRADRRGAAFQRIRFLRSSSAPLSPSLHREFLDKFPLLLVQAMGSTEAGNIFSNPLPPGENKIGSAGLPWGFEAKVVSADGAEAPPGEPGEILVRGPAMMQGYYKEPEATAAVLDRDGWLRTGDLAQRDEDGYFFVVGRSKELIIKGGVNIAPRQIDDALESHPAVLEAAAVGVPDRYLGEDLVAFVVLRAGVSCDERQLLGFCESRLGHFKTPSRIHLVQDLPKGPSGKVQRLRLRDEAARRAAAAPPATGNGSAAHGGDGHAPTGSSLAAAPAEQLIAETWAELLQEPQVDVDCNFFALGGNSLLAIQCLSRLREKLPVVLSLTDFFENATVAQQAALVRRLGADAAAAGVAGADGRADGQASPDGSAAAPPQAILPQASPPARPQAIPPRDRARPCPLSRGQQRLWFLEQLNPGAPIYNEAEAVRWRGELDAGALEQALGAIVARHEVLRTTIDATDQQPTAVVHESWPLRLKTIDLSAWGAEERQSEVERLLVDEPRRPYRLEAEPGIRATLLRLGPREHVFILMMHHIICDRLSVGILWREMAALYRAFRCGQPSPLSPLPIQFGDYAVWQREQVEGGTFEEDLSFWKENLRGAPGLLELPADRPRPPAVSGRGSKRWFRLDPALTENVRVLGRQERTSLFTIFAAAFNALLCRYTGQEDILVGIPIADRDRPELQSLIGYLIDTHVLRTDLSGDPTFRELLGRVQKGLLGVYSHRAVPFDQVVAAVHPERNLSHAPLFQVMLNWRDRDAQMPFITMEGLAAEPLLAQSRTSKFDVILVLTDAGDEIWLEMEYSTDLFDDDRIERMVRHLGVLLQSVGVDPGRRIGELPLLTEAERRQLLLEWNDTRTDYPSNRCVHELFEEQVERTPEAAALVCGEQGLSYRELNGRANQLARCLRGLGVGPDDLVALYMGRSLELVAAVLGILKAGGAYLPMDRTYPPERLAFMLQDSGAKVLITQESLCDQLPAHAAQTICLDPAWQRVAAESAANLPCATTPDNLAYVMYTSGSTGVPKGVEIPHRAINRLLFGVDYARFDAAVRTAQLAPVSFDASTLEIWGPLLHGGCCVLFPEGVPDFAELEQGLRRHRIQTLWLTASLFNAIVDERPETLRGIEQLLTGGEALSLPHVRRALSLLGPATQLVNGYGPTECTTFACCHPIPPTLPAETISVPIGRPIGNTRAYVLDERRQPLPIGVPGELYLGGDGLARGYLNRPELTAERFVASPFEDGSRLYRTGDVVRWRADGSLEYLGRRDQQVKIRGFRIELGEIESCLRRHPALQDVAVVAREDAPGDKRLVAYVVPRDGEAELGGLRGYLQEKLPEYMVPSAFVPLERLPLTPNGKLDRRALPAPDQARTDPGTGYAAPRTALEEQLAAIWADLLGVKRVGIHDNFFELGGHSLLAVRMLARVEESFGTKLPPAAVFRQPTVAQFALALQEPMDVRPAAAIHKIHPGGSKPPLFFLPSIVGQAEYFRRMVKFLGPDQPVLAVGFPDAHQSPRPFATLEELAEWCVERIREARPVGPYGLAGYSFSGMLAYEVARQLRTTGSEVRLVAILDTGPRPKPSLSRRLRYPWLVLKNLPFWLAEDICRTSLRENVARVKRTIKAWTRRAVGISSVIGTWRVEVERIWDVAGMAPAHRKILEDNLRLFRAYVPKPCPGRITLFRAQASPLLHPRERDLGWGELVAGGVEIHDLPANHVSILLEPSIRVIAERIVERMS